MRASILNDLFARLDRLEREVAAARAARGTVAQPATGADPDEGFSAIELKTIERLRDARKTLEQTRAIVLARRGSAGAA